MTSTVQSVYQAFWITLLVALIVYVVKQIMKRD